jgi:hypothetical protein
MHWSLTGVVEARVTESSARRAHRSLRDRSIPVRNPVPRDRAAASRVVGRPERSGANERAQERRAQVGSGMRGDKRRSTGIQAGTVVPRPRHRATLGVAALPPGWVVANAMIPAPSTLCRRIAGGIRAGVGMATEFRAEDPRSSSKRPHLVPTFPRYRSCRLVICKWGDVAGRTAGNSVDAPNGTTPSSRARPRSSGWWSSAPSLACISRRSETSGRSGKAVAD